ASTPRPCRLEISCFCAARSICIASKGTNSSPELPGGCCFAQGREIMKIARYIAALSLLMTAFATAAHAQDANDSAKEQLDKSPRHLEWVKVKNGNRDVNCFLAYPEVKDKAPAVLVIHEIYGLTPWVRSVDDKLAEAGYIAISPDLLSGAGPNGG